MAQRQDQPENKQRTAKTPLTHFLKQEMITKTDIDKGILPIAEMRLSVLVSYGDMSSFQTSMIYFLPQTLVFNRVTAQLPNLISLIYQKYTVHPL